MKRWSFALGLALLIAAALPALQSGAQGEAAEESIEEAAERMGFSVARDTPLVINSEELEVKPASGGSRRVIFKDRVKAEQADMKLTCDWLEARYPESGTGQPDRVTARGHVRIRQSTNTAMCQQAIFDNVACTATCKGESERASLHRGDDVIEADEIFFDLCKGLVRARGDATVRVRGNAVAE